MNKKLSIIPQSGKGLIVEISDNQVHVLDKINIPYNSISKIIKNETIVTLDKDNKKLLFHNINGSFLCSMKVPFGIAMNVKDTVIYIVGQSREGEVCYLLDLDSKVQTLVNLDLPEPMSYGKAVDDILILGNKMFLIDNIVYPKYTFEYDISIPNKPKWINTIELENNGTYEDIIKGDINEEWMIYLSSSSSGYTGNASHITIEGKTNITLTIRGNTYNDSQRPFLWFKDICLVGDILYVLTDIGLGYYDLNTPDLDYTDIIFINHKIVAKKIIKVNNKQLLLVNQHGYELLNLEVLDYFKGTIIDKFWSYGSIDLSNRELEVFPIDKIKYLEKLEHLDLSNNKFKEFPEALRVCKQLRSLNLKNSGIPISWKMIFLEYLLRLKNWKVKE